MGVSSQLDRCKISSRSVAFGATSQGVASGRVVREGTTVTIYTVGYEKRDGRELMALLGEQGIKALADVRERPMSRKPDFRARALRTFCETHCIEYQSWPVLGSTLEQRQQLQTSGDFEAFAREFRAYAKRNMQAHLGRLGQVVRQKPTALLCYERSHEECHRSVLADLVADMIDATVIAIQ